MNLKPIKDVHIVWAVLGLFQALAFGMVISQLLSGRPQDATAFGVVAIFLMHFRDGFSDDEAEE